MPHSVQPKPGLFQTQNCVTAREFETYPISLFLGRSNVFGQSLMILSNLFLTCLEQISRALLLKKGRLQAANSWVQVKRLRQFLCSLSGEVRWGEQRRGTSSTWVCSWSRSGSVLSASPTESSRSTGGLAQPACLCLRQRRPLWGLCAWWWAVVGGSCWQRAESSRSPRQRQISSG